MDDEDGKPPVTGYVVRYRPTDGGKDDVRYHRVKDSDAVSATITDGLASATEYQVRIGAVNGEGRGQWSPKATVATADLSLPAQMITPWIIPMSSSHVLVSWDYPNNKGRPPLTGYTLRLRPAGGTSDGRCVQLSRVPAQPQRELVRTGRRVRVPGVDRRGERQRPGVMVRVRHLYHV